MCAGKCVYPTHIHKIYAYTFIYTQIVIVYIYMLHINIHFLKKPMKRVQLRSIVFYSQTCTVKPREIK